MKKIIAITLAIVITGSLVIFTSQSEDLANAHSRKKINFTQTVSSSKDMAIGHENHQLVFILSPNQGTLYDASITFTSDKPVQIGVLHEITKDESKGQPIWSVDGSTVYALTIIDEGKSSGTVHFTGAAVALHRNDNSPFVATVSIDGWIRGQPTDITFEPPLQPKPTKLELYQTDIEVNIPLHKGLYNDESVYYIITDSSDKSYAEKISTKQEWNIQETKLLESISKERKGIAYVFTNGIKGDGLFDFQDNVLSQIPSSKNYSPFNSVIEVTWKQGQNKELLRSEEEILEAKEKGRIEFKDTNIILNMPQIIWPGGQIFTRNQTSTSEIKYNDGQVSEINKDLRYVKFLAHKIWGKDGRVLHHIITDASPSEVAGILGVVRTSFSTDESVEGTIKAYQFTNGIDGPGILGFQPIILDFENDEFSPLWRIYNVEWVNQEEAILIQTMTELEELQNDEKISVNLARPINHEQFINAPLVNPFQNMDDP